MSEYSRAYRECGFTIRGNTEAEILAVVRVLDRRLLGVRIGGVRPIEGRLGETRWKMLVQGVVAFELTPEGNARPTQRNAELAFKAGRRPE